MSQRNIIETWATPNGEGSEKTGGSLATSPADRGRNGSAN